MKEFFRKKKLLWHKLILNFHLNQCSATPRAKRKIYEKCCFARKHACARAILKIMIVFSEFFFIFPFSCFKDINYFEKFLFLNNSLESWQKLWRERNREKVSSNSDWALILFCFTVTSQEIFEKYRSITELLGLADSTIIATLDSFGNRGSKAGRSAFLFFCRFRMLRKSAKLIFWYR